MSFVEQNSIVALLNNAEIAGMHPEREFVEAGGRMRYGIDLRAQWRRTALYVDRILAGASPRNLLIERPAPASHTGTARRLGVHLPAALLTRADEVFE